MMPRLWQAVIAVTAALLGAFLLYWLLTWLVHLPLRPSEHGAAQQGDAQQRLIEDLVKVSLGLAAGVGAAVALVVAYRRAKVQEAASHRDDHASQREDERLFSDRFREASDLLGHDSAAVRLAGVYALARLADDWADQRQQCVDVLCAYIRLPYDPEDSSPGQKEVRLTVLRLVGALLRQGARGSWQGLDFDFTGAVFDGGDLHGAQFSAGTVIFVGAQFSGGTVDLRRCQTVTGDLSPRYPTPVPEGLLIPDSWPH